jgi:hypothetical protein
MSKSAGAAAVDVTAPAAAASSALQQLGLQLPQDLVAAPVTTLWAWALENFDIASLARSPGPDNAQSSPEQQP